MNLNGMGGPGMGSGTHTRQRVAATGGSKTWRAGMSGPRVHIRLCSYQTPAVPGFRSMVGVTCINDCTRLHSKVEVAFVSGG